MFFHLISVITVTLPALGTLDYRNLRLELYLSDISYSASTPDSHIALGHFIRALNSVADKYAPFKKPRVTNRSNPWFTSKISKMLMVRDTAWSKAHATTLRSNWQYFHQLRNQCPAMIWKAKASYCLSSLSFIVEIQQHFGRLLKPYLIVTIQYYLTKKQVTLPKFLTHKKSVMPLTSTLLLQAISLRNLVCSSNSNNSITKNGQGKISALRLRLIPITRVMSFITRTVIADTHHYIQNWVSAMAESQEAVRKSQRMSKVWDHFTIKREDNKVQHVYCKAELAYHNSTSTMIQHLNRKHPVVNTSSLTQANIMLANSS